MSAARDDARSIQSSTFGTRERKNEQLNVLFGLFWFIV